MTNTLAPISFILPRTIASFSLRVRPAYFTSSSHTGSHESAVFRNVVAQERGDLRHAGLAHAHELNTAAL